ncbi:ras-related protein Rap1-like [Saccostrea echinata]|uniref:ras-related protein Rap1-like n=1 Tax=Saccostrea echinata TaxID=191078 RepID=UPI002A80F38C|nr:ras-related protein Rap1-like [Saccostrea echinata]
MKPVKIVFMGDEEVGKTSLIHQFLYGVFTERTPATLGQSYHETVTLPDGLHQIIEIMDTTGLQEFPAMREMYIQNGNHFVVVYSVESQLSFVTAQNICNDIRRIKGLNFSNIVLVGNKIDKGLSRKVSTELAFKMAAVEMKIWFLEASAYLNLNVDSIFHSILKKSANFMIQSKLQTQQRLRIFSDSEFKCNKTKSIVIKTTRKLVCKSAFSMIR